MDASAKKTPLPPPLIALAGWLVPGLGYWLLGERARGLTIGATIMALFLGGILVAGIRAIDVPGYDDSGKRVILGAGANRQWALPARPLTEIANKPWYICQIMAGPVSFIGSAMSIAASADAPTVKAAPKVKARLGEIGTLYTAVAGMLNLLAIIDAAHRAGQRGEEP